MKKLWISTPKFTAQVNINENSIIILAPPVWKKFKGVHISRLVMWLKAIHSAEEWKGCKFEELCQV